MAKDYEQLIREGHIKNGSFDQIEGTVLLKESSFAVKVRLAMGAVKADLWEALPGWESVEVLRPQHLAKWPYPEVPPKLLKGNEMREGGALKLRKSDCNVLDYAWDVAHYMHKMRFGSYSANPRWLGLMIDVAKIHSPDVTVRFVERVTAMRMSYQLPEYR